MIKDINEGEFEKELSQGVMILDFYATWCRPCRTLMLEIQKVETQYPDVKIGKINIDESPELTSQFKINAVPTVVFLKDGVEVDRFVGLSDANSIKEKLEKHLIG